MSMVSHATTYGPVAHSEFETCMFCLPKPETKREDPMLAGHRYEGVHDCFLTNCKGLGPEVKQLQDEVVRLSEQVRVLLDKFVRLAKDQHILGTKESVHVFWTGMEYRRYAFNECPSPWCAEAWTISHD